MKNSEEKKESIKSRLALYRKYRPSTFDDVYGQDHVVSVLEAQVKSGKFAHAYLFSGGRGIGKTSIARILAHEAKTAPEDIYEIDAASNRGIDDIRELRDGVNTLPFRSPYKVYIIDEVHMLTKEAFNALLKTLEEPPAHVIFMLATTEMHKIPDTIISRCQTYILKKPTLAIVADVILKSAKKEGVAIAPDAAELIALLGDGSFRDAYGILQKVISFSSDKKITRAEIETITGAPKDSLVFDYIEAITVGDIEKGLLAIGQAKEQGVNFDLYERMIVHTFRMLLLSRFAPKHDLVMNATGETIAFYKKMMEVKSDKIQSKTLVSLLHFIDTIRSSYIPELALELALLDIVRGA